MVVSAIIETINYNTKTCTVLIPDLQSSADPEPVIREAALIESLGTQNSYKVGDKVWVSFIRNEKRFPIVIGRILTTDANYTNIAGAGNFTTLTVTDETTLPATTLFDVGAINADYNSLNNIINKLKQFSVFYDTYFTEMVNIKNNSIRYAVYCTEETKPNYEIGTIVFVKTQTINETDATIISTSNNYSLGTANWTLYLIDSTINSNMKEFALDPAEDSNKIELAGKWQVQATMTGAVFMQRIE